MKVLALAVADMNLSAGTAVIRRGKGGKARTTVPFGPRTAQAIDRFIRLRRKHRLAGSSALWLGPERRGIRVPSAAGHPELPGDKAGIEHLHPHMFRHTAADRWLPGDGSEGGLMAVAAWTRPDMLLRDTRARAKQWVTEEARKLELGDI